ncbi:MAG: type II toxin-antitoxin system RatA family toxin [Kiloniellales bacterium]|nr:type II toxin-antitoxin system RatA family toxin [Kiloniellales bacterium]
MPTHAERRVLPYSSAQLYNLVADVARYPEFLPWCIAARIKQKRDSHIIADLVIGFKMIRERFTSHVYLNEQEMKIDVSYVDGPFKHLRNHWIFEPHPDGCEIDFYVDFEFRNRLLQKLMEALFHEAVRRMVAAFESRANDLYGQPADAPAASSTPKV